MRVTPRQQRHAEMKAAIVDAARSAILDHGPERFSLREVARRSGYSPAGLYEYFSGKEDLVRTVAEESLTLLHAALSQTPIDIPPSERLIALGLAYIRFARQNPQHFMLIFTRLPSQRPSLDVPPSPHSPFHIVLQTVRDGIEAGALLERPGCGLEQMAYGLWALAHGIAMLQQTHLQQFAATSASHDRAVLAAYVRGLEQN